MDARNTSAYLGQSASSAGYFTTGSTISGACADVFAPDKLFSQAISGSTIFVLALIIGLALRLIPVVIGDISPGGDGTERLALAVAWADHPSWKGLSGTWPYAHFYFLGALIRLWNEPIILAKLVNLLFGMGAVVAFRPAVRPLFGDVAASVCSLLLAICWTHIWLTSAYWVELPFILLVILAVHFANRTLRSGDVKHAIASGLFLFLALLLRHEGMLLVGLFAVWYAIRVRRIKLLIAFAALPVGLAAWYFIEPALRGHSYFEFASFVREAKAGENLVQGFTLKDCLVQWVLMPMGVPSLFVVIPGFYGLWKARRTARSELFAWMFAAQMCFYLTMTFNSAWRPQLRYVLLYFVNLFPYAAYAWTEFIQYLQTRFRIGARRYLPVLGTLVALTILTQSAAWWVGRNNHRSMGWLPIETLSTAQKSLDDWMLRLSTSTATAKKPLLVVAFLPGSVTEPWSLKHSELVDHISSERIDARNIYVPEQKQVLEGNLPDIVNEANIIIISPQAVFYPTVLEALRKSRPDLKLVNQIHSDIAVLSVPGDSTG